MTKKTEVGFEHVLTIDISINEFGVDIQRLQKVVLGKKSTSNVQVPDAIALNAQIDCEQQLLRFLLYRL